MAQPEQRELPAAAGQDPGDVGKARATGDLDFVLLGPVLLGMV
jgi:hypothetical protein